MSTLGQIPQMSSLTYYYQGLFNVICICLCYVENEVLPISQAEERGSIAMAWRKGKYYFDGLTHRTLIPFPYRFSFVQVEYTRGPEHTDSPSNQAQEIPNNCGLFCLNHSDYSFLLSLPISWTYYCQHSTILVSFPCFLEP